MSIFVISTYNTDYILVKNGYIDKAINVLIKEGYEILR
ncbi:ACT domain-containing protein [Defluviitalea phaphyphila]